MRGGAGRLRQLPHDTTRAAGGDGREAGREATLPVAAPEAEAGDIAVGGHTFRRHRLIAVTIISIIVVVTMLLLLSIIIIVVVLVVIVAINKPSLS